MTIKAEAGEVQFRWKHFIEILPVSPFTVMRAISVYRVIPGAAIGGCALIVEF